MKPGPLHTLNSILSAGVATVIIGGAAWALIRPQLVLAEDLQPLTDAIEAQGKSIERQAASLSMIEKYIIMSQIDRLTAEIATLQYRQAAEAAAWGQEDAIELAGKVAERNRAETSLAALDQ